MSKIYNLKQETNSNSDQTIEQLSELQMTHKHNRRKNEILNGFVFMIGLVGFAAVFMLPQDCVYSNSKLENSFSNSSPLASSSFTSNRIEEEKVVEISTEIPVKISGYYEADEVLEFELETFQSNSEVVYTIHFGNGESREISDKVTFYKYPKAGSFVVNVTATYQKDTKQIFTENISIDEAIIVNSEAFVERN